MAREDHVDSYNLQDDVWRTLAVMAAVVYLIMILLYTARLFMYHKKCVKEWHCPMRSPAFGTITITCTLLGFLAYDQFETRHFGRGLVWMGAVSHAVLTITKFGEWIGKRYELEHVHPSWLILPVGGFVQALVIPIVPAIVEDGGARETALGMDQNIEFANFFFGFAYFMWIALFAITFFKAVTTHNSDDRLRSQVCARPSLLHKPCRLVSLTHSNRTDLHLDCPACDWVRRGFYHLLLAGLDLDKRRSRAVCTKLQPALLDCHYAGTRIVLGGDALHQLFLPQPVQYELLELCFQPGRCGRSLGHVLRPHKLQDC